ncbi:MAG: ParB/RepB/Spo0J family partition protein [Flavobacteriales bacterium]|nr:ParB/RepB/Spo0J family partition protein [Flavobacteriales bacterium]
MFKMSKKVLGRGLSALLNDASNDINSARDEGAGKIVGHTADLDINTITTNPFQPRTQFSEEHLEELATSIRQFGVIQPITVRKVGFNSFQLISGERRFRASKRAGLTHIPAYIRLADDQQMLEMALIENIQRRDLDPIEVASSFKQLIDECHLTQEEMSARVGKKRSTITNYLRLLRLEPVLQAGMRDGILSMGHGRALINVEDPKVQLRIYQMIVSGNLSVRQTEKLVKDYQEGNFDSKRTSTTVKVTLPPEIAGGAEILKKCIGAKVDVRINEKGRGSIVIPFKSKEEFERIKNILSKQE